jgi:hypothetical protein
MDLAWINSLRCETSKLPLMIVVGFFKFCKIWKNYYSLSQCTTINNSDLVSEPCHNTK